MHWNDWNLTLNSELNALIFSVARFAVRTNKASWHSTVFPEPPVRRPSSNSWEKDRAGLKCECDWLLQWINQVRESQSQGIMESEGKSLGVMELGRLGIWESRGHWVRGVTESGSHRVRGSLSQGVTESGSQSQGVTESGSLKEGVTELWSWGGWASGSQGVTESGGQSQGSQSQGSQSQGVTESRSYGAGDLGVRGSLS